MQNYKYKAVMKLNIYLELEKKAQPIKYTNIKNQKIT